MDEHIIKITGWKPEGGYWRMTIDLRELMGSAGIRRSRPGYSEKLVSIPMTKAKKLLKLIQENGTMEDIGRCSQYFKEHFAENPKLAAYWEEMTK